MTADFADNGGWKKMQMYLSIRAIREIRGLL
jgi:hypothetical protein